MEEEICCRSKRMDQFNSSVDEFKLGLRELKTELMTLKTELANLMAISEELNNLLIQWNTSSVDSESSAIVLSDKSDRNAKVTANKTTLHPSKEEMHERAQRLLRRLSETRNS